MKKQYPQLKSTGLRFEDKPDSKMIASGVLPEYKSACRDGDVILFLFNIYDTGKNATDYRENVRRILLRELGDLIGEDLAGQE